MITVTYLQVHACDVVAKMIAEDVKNVNDFEWISQLRQVNINITFKCELMVNSSTLSSSFLGKSCHRSVDELSLLAKATGLQIALVNTFREQIPQPLWSLRANVFERRT